MGHGTPNARGRPRISESSPVVVLVEVASMSGCNPVGQFTEEDVDLAKTLRISSGWADALSRQGLD
eukprot:8596637-Prorocentrum_lima.AAC.1